MCKFILIFFLVISYNAYGYTRGIYITQSTLENTQRIRSLIKKSKMHNINTFVIDFKRLTKQYKQNIKLVERSGIRYVARIVLFPNGGTYAQVTSKTYWRRKYRLAESAISLGAKEIQLDYIRYKASRRASDQNAGDIYRVIKWFKKQLRPQHIPLQIDVFGETSFGPSRHIGQDVKLFADSVDAMCPMVYPSHYQGTRHPYFTIFSSLRAFHNQFKGKLPFKLYPYIEVYSYRLRQTRQQKLQHISDQLRAVKDSNTDGFFVWNPRNQYDNLFTVLKMQYRRSNLYSRSIIFTAFY